MYQIKYDYYLQAIEKDLASYPLSDTILGQSMSYSLNGGGKRIRPVLALACAELVGGNPMNHVREANAIELIHTYSLIHDDLPAMDDDDFRRGRPSNHKVYGDAMAILAGDALLTLAFEYVVLPYESDPVRKLRVIRELAQAAGSRGMVGGQVLDTISGRENENSLSDIERIHRMKTGALLICAARMGAILGGGTEEDIQRITLYAEHIGLAFQIRDDILDVTGDSQVLGKLTGSDQKLHKSTFVSILGIEGATQYLDNTIQAAKHMIHFYGNKGIFLENLADYIATRRS